MRKNVCLTLGDAWHSADGGCTASAAKATQQGSADTAKEVLLDALRLDLQNISRTARAIAQDEPGFADTFRPPDAPSQIALLTTTDAFLAQFQDAPTDTAAEKKLPKPRSSPSSSRTSSPPISSPTSPPAAKPSTTPRMPSRAATAKVSKAPPPWDASSKRA